MPGLVVVRNELYIPEPNEVAVLVRDKFGRDKSFSKQPNLRTNAGADWQKNQMSGTAAAVANFIGVSTTNAAPAAGDTSLGGEQTTNGLARAAGTFTAGAAGSTSYTLARTYTYTGVSALTLWRAAMFNASTGGTMPFASLFSSSAVMETNDQITVTWTINI